MYMYFCVLWYNLWVTHCSLCYSSWTFLSFAFFCFTHAAENNVYYRPMAKLQVTTVFIMGYTASIAHFLFLFYATMSLHLSIALTPNGDSVKPKPQLCMNQNNNPQRLLLPPFRDTLCDSFAAKSSTRENPLRFISSTDTPTCWGVTAGCPSSAFQPELMTVCVCVCVHLEDVSHGRPQRSVRTGEHLWIPSWCYSPTY